MPITPWLPYVNLVADGQDVSAEVVNPILAQYTQRDQYLFEKFQDLTNTGVLIAPNLPILPSSIADVRKNLVVFYDQEGASPDTTEGISPALVSFANSSIFSSAYTPGNSSYATGIVKDVSGTNADVYLMGLINLDVNIDDPDYGLIQSDQIDEDAPFVPAPYYLSRTEAGKITSNPGGVSIYIGYALNRTTFLLAPNVSEFNQFFTTYKFNILDRPSGEPSLSDGIWSISGVSEVSGDGGIDHVGWVPVASLADGPLAGLIPDGSTFFYNLPNATLINADTAIDDTGQFRLEQVELAASLPPNPTNVTLLTVNGIIQASRDNDPEGIYVVNAAGIWWFSNADGLQPWSSDIPSNVTVTFDHTANHVIVPNGAFVVGDRLRFETANTMPTGLTVATDYYVLSQSISSPNQLITVSTSVGGSVQTFSSNGSGTISISQLYIWKFANGTDEYRPRISLQFLKFNPSLSESLVTSLRKYNTSSNAISFYTLDKSAQAISGDLLVRLLLNMTAGTPLTSSATAIGDFTYDETTGLITKVTTPIVSQLIPGSNISITPTTIGGVITPGSFIISTSTSAQTGRISDVEPNAAELIYVGLNSYLKMPPYTTLPSSFIAKILLASSVPDADMTLVLLLMGDANLTLNNANNVVTFSFSYAVSTTGSILNSTISPTILTFNIPNTVSAYTATTCFKLGGVTNAQYAINIPALRIPSSAFTGGDCNINFQIARTDPGANSYTGNIGILDMYWKIG